MPTAAESMYPDGPSNVLGNKRSRITDLSIPTGKTPDEYETIVDEHIERNRLEKDDVIRVDEGDGKFMHYKYLGPKSGARKDWMLMNMDEKVPVS